MTATAKILGAVLVLVLCVVAGGYALDVLTGSESPDEPAAEPTESDTSTPSSPPAGGVLDADVELDLLPPIAQGGDSPAALGAASPVLTARVTPAMPGEVVLLQRGAEGDWATVAEAPQDSSGTALFTDVPPPTTAGPLRYRAIATSSPGLRSRASAGVDPAAWEMVFSDEFGGTSLDTSLWGYRQVGLYNPNGSRECSKSDESAVAVAGGTLILQVERDPARLGESCETAEDGTHGYYLNGHVSTEGIFDFEHGIAAARVKFQRGRGQHGAFWLQRGGVELVPGDPEASGAEIDVAEYFGDGYPKGGLASFVYYLDAAGENERVGGVLPRAGRLLDPGDDWWRSYHVFSVEWTPEQYVFRVDGRPILRTGEGISGVEQFLVLSLLSSDWELARLDESDPPAAMGVDWVGVWQRRAES